MRGRLHHRENGIYGRTGSVASEEPANIADGADFEQRQDIPHSWPYLREMFDDVSSKYNFW